MTVLARSEQCMAYEQCTLAETPVQLYTALPYGILENKGKI